MQRAIRVLLLVLLTAAAMPDYAGPAAACPPPAAAPTAEALQAAMRNAHDHGFLWRISKDGRTSYLFGTIHLAKLDWAYPGPVLMQALRATDTVALELDLLDPDIRERMTRSVAAMRQTAMPEALIGRIRRQAESECVPYDSIATLTPEMQVVTLTMLAGRPDGLDPAYAIDAVLAGVGHGAKRTVVSLETPESQLQVLQMHDAQETLSFVESGLDELAGGHSRAVLARLAKAWANGDDLEVAHYEEWCDCLHTEIERTMMKRVLDDRNPVLASRIDELHQSGKRVFAAVGSLHMFGPLGLPALMEKRGFRVERVELGAR